ETALQCERELGLDAWSRECPPVEGIGLTVARLGDGHGTGQPAPVRKAFEWHARLDAPARSVDQRLKIPAWIDAFEQRGGRLVIVEAGLDELEQCARTHDLTIVASGKGALGRLFKRDAARSPFDAPQRALALTYVTGMRPVHPLPRVCFNLIP